MPRARAALAAALLLASGCSRCGRSGQFGPPERHLPASAPIALVMPALSPAAQQLGELQETLLSIPAMAQLAEDWKSLKTQLGFDPLDRKGLEEAGIDPAGGAAVALGGGAPLLILPVHDPSRFDGSLARLARDRLGAAVRNTSTLRGQQLVAFHREANGPAALAYALSDGYALVSAGSEGPAAVVTAAVDNPSASLAADPAWQRGRAAVGSGFPIVLFAPRGSSMLPEIPLVREGAALGLRTGSSSLGMRAAVLYGPERASWFAGLAKPSAESARMAGVSEVTRMGRDSNLVLRWGGDPLEPARRLLAWLPPRSRVKLEVDRLDLERDLLANLHPGVAIELSLSPTFTFADFAPQRSSASRSSPTRLFDFEALARVKDPDRARSFFARLTGAAPRWNGKATSRPAADGSTTWALTFGDHRLTWSLAGDRLAIASTPELLEALLQRSSSAGFHPPTRTSRAALEDGIGGAVLQVGSTLKSLPAEAYGTGPNRFVLRSLAERFLEPISQLQAVSLRFDLTIGAAIVDFELEGRREAAGHSRP